MALDENAAIAQIKVLVAQVTGLNAVYASSEAETDRLPDSLNIFPCALIFPGDTLAYGLSNGQHRHTYQVKVQVVAAAAELGVRAKMAMPYRTSIIEKFVANVTLGNRVNSCIWQPPAAFVEVVYGGQEYVGWEMTLELSEQASAAPATGS